MKILKEGLTDAGEFDPPQVVAPKEATFFHPETGELLETQEQFIAVLSAIEEEIAPLYRLRRAIRDVYTARFEPVLPEKRWQSMTQEKVASCPRCSGELRSELRELDSFA